MHAPGGRRNGCDLDYIYDSTDGTDFILCYIDFEQLACASLGFSDFFLNDNASWYSKRYQVGMLPIRLRLLSH